MRRAIIVIVTMAVVGAIAGVALATIPDSSGVIHGCYDCKTGALRVIDTDKGQTCAKSETALPWNQSGPQGPQQIMYAPYGKRMFFDVINDGTLQTFNFTCDAETGHDALTGATGIVTDESAPDTHVVTEAPTMNFSVSAFGYFNSGYVYVRGNPPDGPVKHLEVDVACAKIAS